MAQYRKGINGSHASDRAILGELKLNLSATVSINKRDVDIESVGALENAFQLDNAQSYFVPYFPTKQGCSKTWSPGCAILPFSGKSVSCNQWLMLVSHVELHVCACPCKFVTHVSE